jgi:hypothetical protein
LIIALGFSRKNTTIFFAEKRVHSIGPPEPVTFQHSRQNGSDVEVSQSGHFRPVHGVDPVRTELAESEKSESSAFGNSEFGNSEFGNSEFGNSEFGDSHFRLWATEAKRTS